MNPGDKVKFSKAYLLSTVGWFQEPDKRRFEVIGITKTGGIKVVEIGKKTKCTYHKKFLEVLITHQ